MKNLSLRTKKILAVVLTLLVWQVAAMVIHSSILLVTPWSVLRRLTTLWRDQGFWMTIIFTVSHIASGFLLAWIAGILMAALASLSENLRILFWPWMAAIKSVPVASFVVICLIWLKPTNLSTFISFLIVLPVVYRNLQEGLDDLDPKIMEMAKIFEINGWNRIRYVILPQIRSHLLSAAGVTAGLAWKSGIAAEVIGTPSGSMGKMIFLSKMYLDTDDLLAWTVLVVLLSVIFEKLLMKLLKKVLA